MGGSDCGPVAGELMYGLERIAMYMQNGDSMFVLAYGDGVTYGDLYKRAEWEWSKYNFEEANTAAHFEAFTHYEAEAKRLLSPKEPMQKLVLPAYDFVVKAAHQFNVLDARGAIGVTESQPSTRPLPALAPPAAQSYL